MSEKNMELAKEILSDYAYWHKNIGINGLCSLAKLNLKTINAIKYHDIEDLTNENLSRLIKGLKAVKDKTVREIDVMLSKLGVSDG